MSDRDEKMYTIKVKCSHCQHLNEIAYSDFRSAMISNHFFKFVCQNENCKKRTFVTYALKCEKYEYGEIPEKVFERMSIPTELKTQAESEKETENETH